LSEILPEDIPIQVRELTKEYANVSVLELVVIVKLIKHYEPKKLFEIGTFDGRTTLNMACNSSEQAEIYTLDLPKGQLRTTELPIDTRDKATFDEIMTGSRFLGTDCEAKIVQLHGDSATFDFSPYQGDMDFVFIDGSHSYEYVINDSRQALKLLRNGKGIILWHDYSAFWKGVMKALEELYLTVNEFKGLKHIKETTLVYLLID
jgi:predicted O-methyltransferase YrrM